MSKEREIRCYDYVNHPYEQVREALTLDPLAIFQAATKAAASRAESVAAELHFNLGALDVSTDISISVADVIEHDGTSRSPATTELRLEWEAAQSPRLFPIMRGALSIYPLTSTETQLDFSGFYKPPLGALGGAMDALIGRRIADVTVHGFVSDVAGYLRRTLAEKQADCGR